MEGSPLSAINIRLKAFGLDHDCPGMFYSPQYRIPMPVHILYKFAASGYTLFVLILQFQPKDTRSPWIFFTNWSYILQCMSFILTALICTYRAVENRCRRPDQCEIPQTFGNMKWYLKLRWVFHNIASTVPYMVTVVYWTFLWPHEQEKLKINGFLHLTVQVHGINSVLAIIDQLMDCTPITIWHFHHSQAFMGLYSIFSMIYSSRVDTPIYPFLDWSGHFGRTTLVSLLLAIVIVMFHVIAIIIKKLQLKYSGQLTVNMPVDFITEQTPLLNRYTLTN